jgi:hypothetical protein
VKELAALAAPATPNGAAQTQTGVPSLEEITPAIAREMLVMNTHNRRLRERTVATMVTAIKRDEWVINGDMIRFSDDGVLIDGQHRLHAVLKAGKPIMSWVMRGLPMDAQETIDIGNHRGYHDVLALRGEVNATAVSAALVWVYRIETDQVRSMKLKPSNGEKDAILQRYPQIRDSVGKVNNWARDIPIPKSVLTALHWRLSQIDEDQADFFFGRLADGIGMEAGDPILLLRRMLFQWGRGRERVEDYVRYAYVVTAWNFWRAKKTRILLQWKRGTQTIPVPK